MSVLFGVVIFFELLEFSVWFDVVKKFTLFEWRKDVCWMLLSVFLDVVIYSDQCIQCHSTTI